MTPRKQQEIPKSEITEFYQGKSILMTGASGFVGTILLEILLRCCPGVNRIYILLREKKGVPPEERKEVLFKKEIFYKIREQYQEMLGKVTVIPGDVTLENLGMNDDDFSKVAAEVSVIFHVAASVSLFKPLRYMLFQNVIATYNIIELCQKLKHVDALVYTSTAYSNSNRQVIEEKIYKLPFTAEVILKTVTTGSDEVLMALFEQCTPNFLNFYTFSKCVAENLLAETAADLPVSIVRPSLITCTWKGSLPGYAEVGSGIYSLAEAGIRWRTYLDIRIGKGFIRVVKAEPNRYVDLIPVDIVANTHLVAAWRQIKERLRSPSVYTCASSGIIHCTTKELATTLIELIKKHPLPNTYHTPVLRICEGSMAYWIHSIFDHYYPAIVFDIFLRLRGHKPRLFRLYRFYDEMMSHMHIVQKVQFEFRTANFQSLESKLNSTDSEIFPVDIHDFSIKGMARLLPTGAPICKWENDKKTYAQRMRTIYVRYLITSVLKWSLIGFLAYVCYIIIF